MGRKWSELERIAQPSTLLGSVQCLHCCFHMAVESCPPILPWGGCKDEDGTVKLQIQDSKASLCGKGLLNSCWISSPCLNSNRNCWDFRFCSRFLWILGCAHCRNAEVEMILYYHCKSGVLYIYTQSQSCLQIVDLSPVTSYVKGQTFIQVRMRVFPSVYCRDNPFLLFLSFSLFFFFFFSLFKSGCFK